LVIMFILVAGLTFNMWEYFPQNAMLMYLWGTVLGTGLPNAIPLKSGPVASDSYYQRPN